jgi:amidase
MSHPIDTTFLVRFNNVEGAGPQVAVKDVFDMAGTVTTNGCKAVADYARPATLDAVCLAGFRSGARIVGKANLHELGFGTSGINPWFGTPVNPRAPERIPGGSSSGPAVAVASGEVTIALGTDTGGSIRFPAACCGIVGLKTTWGRVPLDGVAALAPSMDSVGPLAADVAGVAQAMTLLEPGFRTSAFRHGQRVGRLRLAADRAVDDAIDAALAAAGLAVLSVDPLAWELADAAARVQLMAEVHDTLGWLASDRPEGLGADTRRRFSAAAAISGDDRAAAATGRQTWRAQLEDLFGRFDVLALPTMVEPPPLLQNPDRSSVILRTRAVNLAGVPALSLPVPIQADQRDGPNSLPASLQLVGPWGAEPELLALGSVIEAAIRG